MDDALNMDEIYKFDMIFKVGVGKSLKALISHWGIDLRDLYPPPRKSRRSRKTGRTRKKTRKTRKKTRKTRKKTRKTRKKEKLIIHRIRIYFHTTIHCRIFTVIYRHINT